MAGLPKLDRIDINILAQLQQNGRLSNVDLAEEACRIYGETIPAASRNPDSGARGRATASKNSRR